MAKSYEEYRRILRMDILAGIRIREWQKACASQSFSAAAGHKHRILSYVGEEAIVDAVYRKDAMFLDGIHDDCVGVMKLKRQDSFLFLKQIESGDLEHVVKQLAGPQADRFKDNNFFKFRLRDSRSYFLTPAHVVRTPQMIAKLGALDIDFNATDSEGRLPLFFIARYATSRWVIPTLCKLYDVNPNKSGDLPKYVPTPELLKGDEPEPQLGRDLEGRADKLERTQNKIGHFNAQPARAIWDPPLVRAIKYRNRESLLGFDLLPPGQVDWNQRFQANHMTPLIYAVLRADEIVTAYQHWNDESSKKSDWMNDPLPEFLKQDVVRALWIVKFLAAHPRVDPTLTDSTGMNAKGYAYTNPVIDALQRGLNARNSMKNYSQPIPR